MCYRSTLTALTFAVVSCSTLALAQASSVPKRPGPEVKRLGVFVGKWKVAAELPSGGGMGPGGKAAGTSSCEWIWDGFGVLCREVTVLPAGKLEDLFVVTYDDDAKTYVWTQVTHNGATVSGKGTNDGDRWVWTTTGTTPEGKPMQMRFAVKFTSPDSYEFKNDVGSGDSMVVMMQGTETRIMTPAKPAAK